MEQGEIRNKGPTIIASWSLGSIFIIDGERE